MLQLSQPDSSALPAPILAHHHHYHHQPPDDHDRNRPPPPFQLTPPPPFSHPNSVPGIRLPPNLASPLPAGRFHQSQASWPSCGLQATRHSPGLTRPASACPIATSSFWTVDVSLAPVPRKTVTASSYAVSSHLEGGFGSDDGDLALDGEAIAASKLVPNQAIGIESGADGHVHRPAQERVLIDAGIRDESHRKRPGALWLLVSHHPAPISEMACFPPGTMKPLSPTGISQALLSLPIPLLSLATAGYTIFALVAVVISAPLRCCPPSPFFRTTSFAAQLGRLLVPALRLHEVVAGSAERSPDHEIFSTGHLVGILLLSPLVSLGLLLAVGTAAAFWVFAMVLGDPNGMERKDDGRAAVLSVNAWWQKWLGYCRR
jgi:hypothetical protein